MLNSKRTGPSKLSLRSKKLPHQSQSCVSTSMESTDTSIRHSVSQPINLETRPSPDKAKPFVTHVPDKEPKTSVVEGSSRLSESPPEKEIVVYDLPSSPEDSCFKPSKPKKLKSAPDLESLKIKSIEVKESIVEIPEAAAEPQPRQMKSDRLNAKLRTFQKEAPKKFPVSRQNSSENLLAVKTEPASDSKPLSPVQESTVETISAKPVDATKELPCPVCNKSSGKNRPAHLKACAGKNGLNTAQLLQAVELQKKQAEERIELGLPFFLQNQKPAPKKRNAPSVDADPNIQLALALSKSLKDAEEEAQMRQARLLLEDQDTFDGMTESQVDATIKAAIKDAEPGPAPKNFPSGYQTVLVTCDSGKLQAAKSTSAVAQKFGRTRGVAPYVTATEEERSRRITEKVAMLLLDEENKVAPPKKPDLRPLELKDNLEKSVDLWQLASVSPSAEKGSFYVNGLREFVSPSKANSGFMNLKLPEPRNHTRRKRNYSSPAKKKESSLGRDWASLLNSRTMSDIVVYVREEIELRAHRLVLFVRCPAILKDLASEIGEDGKNVEQMLLWSEFSQDVVMAVLEFLYCDTTCRAMKLNTEDLNDLESLSQRYDISELEEHLNMIKKLREDIKCEDPQENSPEPSPSKSRHLSPKDEKQLSRIEESDDSDEDIRTELSYLVSQMDKSTLLPVVRNPSPKLLEKSAVAEEIVISDSPEEENESLSKVELKPVDDEKPKDSQEDLFASLEEESDIYRELIEDAPTVASPDVTLRNVDELRNLDGLGYLEPSPSRPLKPRSPSPPALGNFDPGPAALETSSFTSQDHDVVPRDVTPLEVVTLSSDSASQRSLSPKAASPFTPDRLPLDDSFEVFEDGDLTRLEMATLKAYEKIMTPKAGPSKVQASTPASAKITPMANYSIMDSPQLQKELDKFGIKKLRRNQAKLILKHIYNELHPIVSSTPLARPQAKKKAAPVKNARSKTQPQPSTSQSKVVRKLSPVKRSSPKKAKPAASSVHNLSSSQPESYDSFDELIFDAKKPKKAISASQPVPRKDSDSGSDDSNDSDNEGFGKYEGDDLLLEEGTQIPETQTNLPDRIEEILKSDPGLYHRILTYEPIWLEEIKDLLKQNKVKCNPKVLLDYLDDQCITYRTEHPRTARQTQKRGWTQTQRGRKKKDFDV